MQQTGSLPFLGLLASPLFKPKNFNAVIRHQIEILFQTEILIVFLEIHFKSVNNFLIFLRPRKYGTQIHFSLLENDPCHSSIDEIQFVGRRI